MKVKIDRERCKFIVKPESRKVICVWNCNKNMLMEFLQDVDGFYVTSDEWRRLAMRPYYVGVATCAPEDEWDEELGKTIAFYKMKKKFYVSFFKRVNYFFDNRDKMLNRIAEDLDRIGERGNRELTKLENEIGSVINK